MKVYSSVVGPRPRGEMLIWVEAFQLTGVVSSVEQPSRFLYEYSVACPIYSNFRQLALFEIWGRNSIFDLTPQQEPE